MRPGLEVNWYDQSDIVVPESITERTVKPLFMVVSSFDKGPEDLREVEGTEFATLYGTPTFKKHGQAALQAQNTITAGGRLLVKRIVAKSSALANLVLAVKVITRNAVNSDGEQIYSHTQDDGSVIYDTTAEGGEKVRETVLEWVTASQVSTDVKSPLKTMSDVSDSLTAAVAAKTAAPWNDTVTAGDLEENLEGIFPLILVTDNGRGVSNKSIRFTPDYHTSKTIGTMFYTLTVFDGTTQIDSQPCSFNPNTIYLSTAYGLDSSTSAQIDITVLEDYYDKYVECLAGTLGIDDLDELKNMDLLFGYKNNGSSYDYLTVSSESVDLNATYGNKLQNGSNGEFFDGPFVTDMYSDTNLSPYDTGTHTTPLDAWADAICAVYNGSEGDDVYDVDQHMIAAILDANYPQKVKDAIAEFVAFREDCIFFRDFGIGHTTYTDIYNTYLTVTTKHNERWIMDYLTSYQVIDPQTFKRIDVTMMYDMATVLVNHFSVGPYRPMAGTVNGFVLPSAIKGTINYTPVVTPTMDQKQAIDDLRINYAIFQDDQCVVQSCYSAQDKYTQLSYGNNVAAIQQVVRAVRAQCPKNRYTFSSATDLSNYATAVNNVLLDYTSNFSSLEFEYTQDTLRTSQKIFYASIKFKFGTWVQSEIIDVYALGND